MSTLIITLGPPGCGKSSAALGWFAADPIRRREISKDGLRVELGVGGNNDENPADVEQAVAKTQHARVSGWLADGHDVVVHDTCQHQATMDDWVRLAAQLGVRLVVWDYRGVPVDACIARDAARGAAGGRLVGGAAVGRVAGRCAAVAVPAGAALSGPVRADEQGRDRVRSASVELIRQQVRHPVQYHPIHLNAPPSLGHRMAGDLDNRCAPQQRQRFDLAG